MLCFKTACEAAGASSARHSLRPLLFRAGRDEQNSDATRRENAEVCLVVGEDANSVVMPGLDPGIHHLRKILSKKMDHRGI
jgi:hypothetical protein